MESCCVVTRNHAACVAGGFFGDRVNVRSCEGARKWAAKLSLFPTHSLRGFAFHRRDRRTKKSAMQARNHDQLGIAPGVRFLQKECSFCVFCWDFD